MTQSHPIEKTPAFIRLMRAAVREADITLYKQHCAGVFAEGDPNHPKYNNGIDYTTGQPATIFGYGTAAFMLQQYK